MFMEPQLIMASKNITQFTPEIKIPEDHFAGVELIMPMEGFFWRMYGDIINIDPETILIFWICNILYPCQGDLGLFLTINV